MHILPLRLAWETVFGVTGCCSAALASRTAIRNPGALVGLANGDSIFASVSTETMARRKSDINRLLCQSYPRSPASVAYSASHGIGRHQYYGPS